jgi:hypothetical protein
MKHDSRQFDNDGFAVMVRPATVSPHLSLVDAYHEVNPARYASEAFGAPPKREGE